MYDKLVELVGKDHVEKNKPLKEHTYTKLGGHADYFVTPQSFEAVTEVVKYANETKTPLMLLGNGSNLIIKDGGIRGIVMYLGELNKIEVRGHEVRAESGALIASVSKEAGKHELTGLEFACGIPGSVGGALFMNAGAYGGEIKDVLKSAKIVTNSGEIKTLQSEELDLAYRKSNIPDRGYIVLEACFELKQGNLEEINAVMADLTHRRETKQPLEYPTCGSVFKRPPGYFAGKLIQDSKLQGSSIGGAEVSLKHAGFIINKSNATASEYIALIEHVQDVVKEKQGVELEREVRIIGEDL